MPGSLRHPRAESWRLRSPVGGGSPRPLRCSRRPASHPSAPPRRSALARPSRSSLVSLLSPAGRHLAPAGSPPSPAASPTVRLPLASAPRPLASGPLLFLPPLSSSPSSAPRPSAGCRLPPPRSAAQPQAGSLRPGNAEPLSPHPGLRQCTGRAGSSGGRCSFGRTRDPGGGGGRAVSFSLLASCAAGGRGQGIRGSRGT